MTGLDGSEGAGGGGLGGVGGGGRGGGILEWVGKGDFSLVLLARVGASRAEGRERATCRRQERVGVEKSARLAASYGVGAEYIYIRYLEKIQQKIYTCSPGL